MNQVLKVVVAVDNIERAHFFHRLLCRHQGEVVYVTGCYRSFMWLRDEGEYAVHLGRSVKSRGHDSPELDDVMVQESIEVLAGSLSANKARFLLRLYVRNILDMSLGNEGYVLLWNGNNLISKAIGATLRNKWKFRYIEISNLTDKLFVNSKGVNGQSSLVYDTTCLDRLPPVADSEHNEWLHRYYKEKSKPLGQVKKMRSIDYRTHCLSILGRVRGYYYAISYLEFMRLGRLLEKISRFGSTNLDIELTKNWCKEDYVFLPLQVSSDTQLLINGLGYDNESAVEYCLAAYPNNKIVIKPHPAEKNLKSVESLMNKYRGRVIFTSASTQDLIRDAKLIVTINSTVGFEAKMLGKDVTVLGLALYKSMSYEQIKKYIHRYLVGGVDYFGTEPLNIKVLDDVLNVPD